jgi:2-phosphosulfolactate phosphatase
VKGKSIIYCTTNGSVALAKSRYARALIVGSFLNLTTVVEFVKEENKDFLFICAGRINTIGYFSLEDAVCAGMMIQKLMKVESLELNLSDSAKAAHALYKTFGRSILKMLKTSEHGRFLIEIGYADDLKICAAVDSVPVLPVQIENKIKLKKEEPPVVSA